MKKHKNIRKKTKPSSKSLWPIYLLLATLFLVVLIIGLNNKAKAGTPPAEPARYDKIDGGITTDSTDVTAELKAAIIRAQKTTGYVRLDSGVIVLSDSIVIPEGVELVANGTRARFIDAAKGFVMRNSTGIKGFGEISTMWTGASQTGGEEFGAPISVGNRSTGEGYHDVTIENLSVLSGRTGGSNLTITGTSYNVNVNNVRCLSLADSTRFGVLVKYASDSDDSTYHPYNITLSNIWVDTLDPVDTNGYAISLDGCYGAEVNNVTTQYAYLGIDVRPDSFGFTYAHSSNGIDPDGSSPSVKVTNSHFNDIWTWGVRVSGSVEKATSPDTVSMPILIIGCTFTGQDTTDASGYDGQDPTGAMHRFHAMGVKYINCSFFNWQKGISFDAVDGVTFTDCLFERNVYDAYISSSSYPDNITIENSSFRRHGDPLREGVYIGKAGHVTIQNNRFGRPQDTTYRYPIRVADPSGTAAKVKILNNHVVNLNSQTSAQAYYLQYNQSIAAFLGNTIDTQYVDTSEYTANTYYKNRWQGGIDFIGAIPQDTSVAVQDNYVPTYDAGTQMYRWEAAPGSGGGDDLSFDSGGATVDVTNAVVTEGRFIEVDIGGSVVTLNITGAIPDSNVADNITITGLGDSTNWNTAYGWGNHASTYLPLNGGTMAGGIDMDEYYLTLATNVYITGGDNANLSLNDITTGSRTLAQLDGDVTGVTAGAGMTGGGASGALTLNVIAGTGITVNANDVEATLGTAITTGEITNGTILFEDIGQNGATTNQIMKWSGSAWAAAADISGGSSDTALALSEAAGGDDKVFWDNDTLFHVWSGGDTLRFYADGGQIIMDGGGGLTVVDSMATLDWYGWISGSDTTFVNKATIDSMINLTGRYAAGGAIDADNIIGDVVDDDDLDVAAGGTGVSTLTDGGILIGNGTGDIVTLGVATNGQIPIGDGTTDPQLNTITGTANEVTVTSGAGSITISLPNHAGTAISADLEEEAHASEHNSGGADVIAVTSDMITTQTIVSDDVDSTAEAFVFSSAFKANSSVAGNEYITSDEGDAAYQPLEATLTDIASGSVTGEVINFDASGAGGLTNYDMSIGDADGSPTYGMVRIGNSVFGRTSFSSGNVDIDGAMIMRNVGGPVGDAFWEYVFVDGNSDIRFGLPTSGAGRGTYNPRSMIIAGPWADHDSACVNTYWGFDKLPMNTGDSGADLGVQHHVQIGSELYVDTISVESGTTLELGSPTNVTGNITTTGTVDGVDIAARDAIVDSIGLWGDAGKATDSVEAWDNGALDSTNYKDASISLSKDLANFTMAELETETSDATNILQESEIDASSELLAIMDDETGTGVLVFGTSPTFTTGITVPANSISADELDEDAAFDWTAAHTFDEDIMVNGGAVTGNEHIRATILDPNAAYDISTTILLVPVTEAALTVTQIDITCDADPTTEQQFSIVQATGYIAKTSPTDIEDNITVDGAFTTTAIDIGAVAAGQCIYLLFDSDPEDAMATFSVDITYDFD